MEILLKNESDLPEAASQLLGVLNGRKHVALVGEMGAGKTTLVAAICRELGVVDDVSSPTFSIVNEYHDAADEIAVYHFDFYRIESVEETLDLGLDDYFDSGVLCLMEWPANVEAFLPDDTTVVRIQVREDDSRVINID